MNKLDNEWGISQLMGTTFGDLAETIGLINSYFYHELKMLEHKAIKNKTYDKYGFIPFNHMKYRKSKIVQLTKSEVYCYMQDLCLKYALIEMQVDDKNVIVGFRFKEHYNDSINLILNNQL